MLRNPSLGIALVGALVNLAVADSAIEVYTHQGADGASYSAVAVTLAPEEAKPVPRDLVVLVDTSASQLGEHRTQAFSVLSAMLAELPANDRVSVYAIDLAAEPMTDGLVSPSEALATALPKLERRFPAGATDLAGAMNVAESQLRSPRAGAVVYIGDGMSTARLVQSDTLAQLVSTFRDRQIPINSYAVGSNMDLQLLGILAQQSGGVVLRDDAERVADPGTAGRRLARAVNASVYYPEQLTVEALDLALLPNMPLPIRGDRATIFLGRGVIQPGDRIVLSDAAGSFELDLPRPRREDGNEFLASLWSVAEQSEGLTNGLAGVDLMRIAQQDFHDAVAMLEVQGNQAAAAGRADEAARIGLLLQQADPTNTTAVSLIAQNDDQPAETAPTGELSDREAQVNQSELDRAVAEMDLRTQKLKTEVEGAVGDAQAILTSDPENAESVLEKALSTVKAANDVDPDAKAEMIRVLAGQLQSVRSQMEVLRARIALSQRSTAVQEAQQLLVNAAINMDEDTRQLVERVRSLMIQGYEGNAAAFEEAEAVSRMIESDRPFSAVGAATIFMTEAAGALDKSNRLRLLRSDRYLEALHQVELSHVPFPDEPPVRYPPAEVWQQLTEKRRKWKSVDLHQNSPNEQRIYEQLETTTSIEFQGNPLRDVVQYLSEVHNIPILIDENALQDAGLSADEEINLVISGIKLRSALKLMLENVAGVPLAYVIEDEVMKITTKDIADNTLQTRVYPVADLVIPIQPLGGGFGGGGLGGGGGAFGGGGLGGGGGGGFGGGFGGGGRGGGGFGGGGFGGGGFGGGGGFFSVPDPSDDDNVFNADAVNRLKKKPAAIN